MDMMCVTLAKPLEAKLGVTVDSGHLRPLLTVTETEEFAKETLLAQGSAFYIAGAYGPKGEVQLTQSHIVDALKKARPLTLVLTKTSECAAQLSISKTHSDKSLRVVAVNGQTSFAPADIDKADWLVVTPNISATITVPATQRNVWSTLRNVANIFL